MDDESTCEARERFLSIQDVVNGLADPLERLAFRRDRPWLAAVGDDGGTGGIAASWKRGRDAEDPRDTGDWGRLDRHGNTDGLTVWLDGHLTLTVAGIVTQLEWRKTILDPDEFGLSVEAWIRSVDRFAPAQH